MSKRTLSLLTFVVIATVLLAACSGGGASTTGKGTIKVATQSPLSGGQSAIGVDIKNGAELALEQLKGPLEEMGFKVELAPFDDQANPPALLTRRTSSQTPPSCASMDTITLACKSHRPKTTMQPTWRMSRRPIPTRKLPTAVIWKSAAWWAVMTYRVWLRRSLPSPKV